MTKNYLFTGTVKWAKVQKPDEKYGNYQLPLYLDAKGWADFKAAGLRLLVKEDPETGQEFVTFKRKHEEFNQFRKETVVNGPPKILIKNDDGEYVPFDGLIGNGSVVSARVDIFDTRNGPGHRLMVVGVDKLVEYNPDKKESNVPEMPF